MELIAERDVPRALAGVRAARDRPADLSKAHEGFTGAHELTRAYAEALAQLADAVRTLAAEASAAPEKTERGFRAMLDRYLRYRATGSSDAAGTGGDAAKRQRLRLRGHINFDVPGMGGDPFRFVYSDVRFGAFESGAMSATMSDHVRDKSMADLDDWAIDANFALAHRSGSGDELHLHRDVRGSVAGTSTDDRVVAAGGVSGVWAVLSKWPLGKHWVG